MTYAANLEKENIDSGYLLVIEPRRLVADSAWAGVVGSPTVWKASFDYGEVRSVRVDDTDLTAGTSPACGPLEFYYDVDAEILYLDPSGDPAGMDVVVGYELYFGTVDAHFNRDPLDDTTRVVYFEPTLTEAPEIAADLRDAIFGYLPSVSSSISLGNLEGLLARHLDSSFNSAPLALYHWLGSIATENTKLVYRGLANRLQITDNEVKVSVLDRNNIFDTEYRHTSRSFFDEATFPLVDPNHKNRPIRKVFGFVDGVIGINVASSATLSASTNHQFILHSGSANPGSITRNVVAGGGNTTTKTYLDDVTGLQVDDDVSFTSGVEAVLTVIGPDYVEHDNIGIANVAGDELFRSFIGSVYFVADGVAYRLRKIVSYSEIVDGSADVLGVEIEQGNVNSIIGRYLGPSDLLYCRVYGDTNTSILNAVPFGADSIVTGTLTQGVVHLWNFFRYALGLAEAEIDIDSFTLLQASAADEFGFAIPAVTGNDFPLMRDLIASFCQSLILKVFLNDDGLWAVKQTGPLGVAAKSIEDDEILFKKFVYSLDYQEVVSDIYVEYRGSEINPFGQVTQELSTRRVAATSTTARRLHRVTRQRTYQSFHFLESEAQTLADRLSFYFGERRGLLTLATKNRFFDTEIDDVVSVSRELLPGETFTEGTLRTRSFSTAATSKGLNEIEITLDDQKGIEDNSGAW